ncbi:MAG TPA: 7TM diverse intracellular signaling domain-containing protein, partial [Spirosoma sp.]|nr:7TM diverse intracellular signaling domain-containing protein [Spirosoma sp.]
MSKRFVFLISLLVTVSVSAQSVHILTDSASAPINTYAVLPDQGYTLDQVRTDTTLRFVLNDSLRPAQTRSYWLRLVVANPAHDDERYNLSLHPSLHNTLYYFDANRQRWISHQGGVDVPQKGRRDRNLMPFVAQGQAQTSLYIHVDLKLLPESDQSLKPKIIIEKQAATTSREQFLLITWITSLSVLFLFFLNNLFVYLSFRDKIVLYYLIEQVGGMIYITYYKDFFDVLFSGPFFTLGLSPSGYIHYFSLGSLLQHSSIVLMLYGLVQMTRAYFNTPITLPRLDSLLKTGLVMYGLFTAVILGINVGFVYGEDYTLKYHNMLAFLVIGSIMGTCVAGYRRRLPAAGAFLLANMLPLTFMLATTLFNVLMNGPTPKRSFLPDLVIITQSLAFSVALVARTKLIQKELT